MSEGWVFEALDVAGDYSLDGIGGQNSEGFSEAAGSVIGVYGGVSAMVSSARALGAEVDGLLGPLVTLSAALQVTAGAYQLYKAAASAVAALRAAQEAAAAAEGAAAAVNPLMWPNLAIAGAAMATVYATFQFASGEWHLPEVDISSVSSRIAAAEAVRTVQ